MADDIYIKHNLGSFQQPYIFQQPGIGQTPAIGTTRYPFIGNTRQPNIYQFRTPQTYQAQGNNQQPNIRDAQEPNIRDSQQPLIGSSQEPNIRDQQEPNIRDKQEPNIRDSQQPTIRQQPAPYPYITTYNIQTAVNYQTPFTYTYPAIYQVPSIGNTRQPGITQQPSTGDTQLPTIIQRPAPYPFITTYNIQTSVNYQTPFTYPYIASSRSSVPYSYRSPSTSNVGETLQFDNNATVDLTLDGDDVFDSYLDSFPPPTSVGYDTHEISFWIQKFSNYIILYARLTSDSNGSATFTRHNNTPVTLSTSSNTNIVTWTPGTLASMHPTGVRFVVTHTGDTDDVNLSGDNSSTSFSIGNSPHATTGMSSTTVNSSSASGSFTSMGSTFSGGITVEQDASSSGAGSYTAGGYSVTGSYNLFVQFSRANSANIIQSSPLRFSITHSTELTEEEDDCPQCCVHEDMMVSVGEDMTKLNVTPAKSIHDLKIGDNVVSHNFETGKDEIVEIEDIITVQRDVDYRVNSLIMTEDHPVYLEGGRKASINPEATAKNYGQDVDQLVVGDKMIKQIGGLETVESIEKYEGTHTNFAIKTKYNNFYADGHLVDSVIRRDS